MVAGGAAAGALVLFVVLRRAPEERAQPAPPPSSLRLLPSGPNATVGVFDDGDPMANRWVVFHDASGAVTSAVRTGTDGKASSPVNPGASVTVAHGTSIRSLVTVVAVEPNDALTVGEAEDEGGADETRCTAVVSLPGRHPKAARYAVELGVGPAEISPDKPLEMSVVDRFVKRGRFQVLAEAVDAAGVPVAFTHAWFGGCENDGGRPAVPARLPAWRSDYRRLPVEVSGGGGEAGTVEASMSIELGGPRDRFARGRREAALSERATLDFAVPRPLGERTKLELAVAHAGTRDRFVLEETRASMPEAFSFDLREQRLPRISGAVVEDASSARPTVRWRVAGDAARAKADVLVVQLSWPATGEHVWTLLLPPDGPQEVTLPALPEELASWRPDGRKATASVALLDASFLDGFAEVKRKGLAALEDPPDDADRVLVRHSVTGDLAF